MHRLSLFFVAVAGLQGTLGQTSLYVPGFDSQALSVKVAGVSDGHTTYIIQPAADATDSGFVGTATLVEGSDYASLTYADPDSSAALTLGYECSIAAGVAVCSGVADGVTILETETVSAFAVEGGATSTAAGSVTTKSSSTAKTGSGSSSATATSTSTAASSTKSNSSSFVLASLETVMGATGVLLGLMSVL